MAIAAVLPFPNDRSKNIGDLQSRIIEAGVEAVKTVVGTLMDKLKGKDFQAVSELLKEQGQQVTGAIFSQLLNAIASESDHGEMLPVSKCLWHS